MKIKSKKSLSHTVTTEDKMLFEQAIGQIKPMVQDTIDPVKNSPKKKRTTLLKDQQQRLQAEFFFSDQFEAHFSDNGPIKYARDEQAHYLCKRLRRGEFVPDLILDLHGYTQQQAKRELAALIAACEKEHAECINIIHGKGSGILKNRLPHWLVQHPAVIAFHQAPLRDGGDGALLVLVEIKDSTLLLK
jgi:DNA-nicking Smr family endonuclease